MKCTKKNIFSILFVFIGFCCLGVACDPAYSDKYNIRNSLDSPIIVVKETLQGNLDSTKINPGESTLIYEEYGMGSSTFITLSEYCGLFYSTNCIYSVIFSDGAVLQWNSANSMSYLKHPALKKYWKVLKGIDKKWRDDYEVEYTVDEEDYRNALAQSGF